MVQRFDHKGLCQVQYKTEKQVKIGLLYSVFMTLWWKVCMGVFVYISKWLVGIEKHYQCKLQVMTTMSASEGFALVE